MEIISFRDLNSDQSRRISGSHYLLLYGKIEEETHIIGSFDHYAYVHDATQSSKIQKNLNQFFEIPKMDFKNKRSVFTCTFPMMVRKVLSLAWNSFL